VSDTQGVRHQQLYMGVSVSLALPKMKKVKNFMIFFEVGF